MAREWIGENQAPVRMKQHYAQQSERGENKRQAENKVTNEHGLSPCPLACLESWFFHSPSWASGWPLPMYPLLGYATMKICNGGGAWPCFCNFRALTRFYLKDQISRVSELLECPAISSLMSWLKASGLFYWSVWKEKEQNTTATSKQPNSSSGSSRKIKNGWKKPK